MADALHVTPSQDIILFSGGPSVQLRVFLKDPPGPAGSNPTYSDVTGSCKFNPVKSGRAEITAMGLAQIKGGTGDAEYTIDRPLAISAHVQLRVYDSISQFWCGNNRVSLFSPSKDYAPKNYVLSIFAQVVDQANNTSFCDLTGHPYFEYVPSTDLVKVDRTDDNPGGCIFAPTLASSGKATITISLSSSMKPVKGANLPTPSSAIDVDVEPLDKQRPVLERLFSTKKSAKFSDGTNILFLADGFTKDSEIREMAKVLAGLLRDSIDDSPFDLLKNAVNYWVAPLPSKESGITGLPVIPPNTKGLVDPQGTLFQPRDSLFGIMRGTRFRDLALDGTETSPDDPMPNPTANRRQFSWDPRRTESGWGDARTFLNAFLKSLKSAKARDGGTPNFDVGATWADGGADEGRVVILCNTNEFMKGVMLFHDLGEGRSESSTINKVVYLSMPSLPPDRPRASTLAHELGHVFELGDEYEEEGAKWVTDNSLTNPGPSDPLAKLTTRQPNITTYAELGLSGAAGIDRKKIKWNWDRIQKASRIVDGYLRETGMDSLTVRLSASDAKTWTIGERGIALRQPLYMSDFTPPEAQGTASDKRYPGRFWPLKILDIKDDQITLGYEQSFVALSANVWFPAGSVLYVPLGRPDQAKDIPTLVVVEVLQWMEKNGPLSTHGDSTARTDSFAKPEFPKEAVDSNLKVRTDTPRTIGVYEGAKWKRNAYRPTGICKMRDHSKYPQKDGSTFPFCPVCQYSIVDRIDPSVHPALDEQRFKPSQGRK